MPLLEMPPWATIPTRDWKKDVAYNLKDQNDKGRYAILCTNTKFELQKYNVSNKTAVGKALWTTITADVKTHQSFTSKGSLASNSNPARKAATMRAIDHFLMNCCKELTTITAKHMATYQLKTDGKVEVVKLALERHKNSEQTPQTEYKEKQARLFCVTQIW